MPDRPTTILRRLVKALDTAYSPPVIAEAEVPAMEAVASNWSQVWDRYLDAKAYLAHIDAKEQK